jgi:hypothetical protein
MLDRENKELRELNTGRNMEIDTENTQLTPETILTNRVIALERQLKKLTVKPKTTTKDKAPHKIQHKDNKKKGKTINNKKGPHTRQPPNNRKSPPRAPPPKNTNPKGRGPHQNKGGKNQQRNQYPTKKRKRVDNGVEEREERA